MIEHEWLRGMELKDSILFVHPCARDVGMLLQKEPAVIVDWYKVGVETYPQGSPSLDHMRPLVAHKPWEAHANPRR